MGRIFVVEPEGRSYRCKFCKTHLALAYDLVSRAFHCCRGKAYLFNKAVNITYGAFEERTMLSGLHIVADIFSASVAKLLAGNMSQHMQGVKSIKRESLYSKGGGLLMKKLNCRQNSSSIHMQT